MRETIYKAIKDRLTTQVSDIYIGLWNQQITNIETGELFDTPAVFLEFLPIEWRRQGQGSPRGDIRISLHIISRVSTDGDCACRTEQSLIGLRLTTQVRDAIIGLAGTCWSPMQPVSSETDHDHDELRHDVESFVCQGVDPSVAYSTHARHHAHRLLVDSSMQS